jgi:CubicO group peptidase (beta-lactamase class C family)
MRRAKNMRRALLPAALCAVGVLLLFLAVTSAGQDGRLTGPESSPALRQAISAAAQKYKIPGIAAAWIANSALRGIEVSGVRDVNSNAPVTPNTVFEAGALGEPLYAYSVLLLAADGRFNPGTPLPNYLPPPYVRYLDATSASPVTEPLYEPLFNQVSAIRVMNHTSGLPDWARNKHMFWASPPGKKWSYSSEGYLYLQKALENFTGESFSDFVARNVLGPARMAHSSFVWRDVDSGDRAVGYDRNGAPLAAQHYARPAATATLTTSIRDYEQFVRLLLSSAPAQRAHESAVSLMIGSTVAVDDPVPFSWGLGMALEKKGDDVFFFHRDKSAGFASFLLANRKTGNALVILTNSGNGLEAVPDIVAATLGGEHPVLKSKFVQLQ